MSNGSPKNASYQSLLAAALALILAWIIVGAVAVRGTGDDWRPVWYLLSVAATGAWAWPLPYSDTLSSWFHYAGIDAVFSINIPGILLSLGLSSTVL